MTTQSDVGDALGSIGGSDVVGVAVELGRTGGSDVVVVGVTDEPGKVGGSASVGVGSIGTGISPAGQGGGFPVLLQ